MSKVRVSCADPSISKQMLTLRRQTASDIIDEPTTEETVDIAEIAEQESAPPKPSTTKAPLQQQEPHIIIDIEPRCEELVWTIGKLIQEQKTWAALNAKRSR